MLVGLGGGGVKWKILNYRTAEMIIGNPAARHPQLIVKTCVWPVRKSLHHNLLKLSAYLFSFPCRNRPRNYSRLYKMNSIKEFLATPFNSAVYRTRETFTFSKYNLLLIHLKQSIRSCFGAKNLHSHLNLYGHMFWFYAVHELFPFCMAVYSNQFFNQFFNQFSSFFVFLSPFFDKFEP